MESEIFLEVLIFTIKHACTMAMYQTGSIISNIMHGEVSKKWEDNM